ncbi:hypothetical protein RJ640_018125, partial [Escallonia rubra]
MGAGALCRMGAGARILFVIVPLFLLLAGPKDVKDLFSALKDSALELNGSTDIVKNQITYSLLFSVVIALISDALSAVPDKVSVLSPDASFRHEFQETVMASGNDPIIEGFVDCARLAWAVHLMMIHDEIDARETVSSSSSNDMRYIYSCLEVIFSNNVFQFLLDKILRTAAYQVNLIRLPHRSSLLLIGTLGLWITCVFFGVDIAENDDEDMIYMYNAYLHKLITCFLSHPLARDKVKETKEKAMTALSPYRMAGSHDYLFDGAGHSQQVSHPSPQTFISLLEFVSDIYQKEPELLSGNDVLWTFVNFAGEDHTNFQTLVAFLKMLSTLASGEEGASKVYHLLEGKTFRSIGWRTLFDCLSIYEEKFKRSLQSAGAILPEFQEGDAKALVAYLNALQKVVENGNPVERKNWFPDIESLFKLLSYENVPPYLKGALRNAISSFIQVSPNLKDTIWSYLEQYDLPVVVGPHVGNSTQPMSAQVYDMRFELNEIEARREQYPSTISFLNLLNALISEERDVTDRGHRFFGIFRFIYDHVFGPSPQRAYADSCEKWQLVVACLQHFKMMLSMYDIQDEEIDNLVDQPQLSAVVQSASPQMQIPVIELLKGKNKRRQEKGPTDEWDIVVLTMMEFTLNPMLVSASLLYGLLYDIGVLHLDVVQSYQDFMSGKTVFRNIMGILSQGVNSIITQRTNQIYGQLLEKAVLLSLEILILVFEKDSVVSDFWRPLYQPLDVILSQDHSQTVALLEYVRYDLQPQIQQCSIKIMSILRHSLLTLSTSGFVFSRMVGLVAVLLKSNSASSLVEDYAACLELRSEECQISEDSSNDLGVLIIQVSDAVCFSFV